jgi:hypothetical protein
MRRLVILSAVLACGGETPRRAVESVDTLTTTAEASCRPPQVHANPDPFDLVREFVRREGEGEFLVASPWLDSAYACPGRTAPPSEFTIVAGYSFRTVAQDAERARMLVTYILVGDLRRVDSLLVLERRVGTVRDTFVVVATEFGWRLDAPRGRQMVLVAPALSEFGQRLGESDRQFLAGIAARRR